MCFTSVNHYLTLPIIVCPQSCARHATHRTRHPHVSPCPTVPSKGATQSGSQLMGSAPLKSISRMCCLRTSVSLERTVEQIPDSPQIKVSELGVPGVELVCTLLEPPNYNTVQTSILCVWCQHCCVFLYSSFEGDCLTTVILAPGACGREPHSCRS